MKHFGDITKLNGTELPIVDIITGGSPCQDLSVAGKRAGLAGERSGLFMDQIRIIKEMRDEDKRRRCGITGEDEYIRPRFMVWENVAGAFSSNKGEDFRAVLEETAKVADENAVIPEPPKGKWTHAGCIVGNGWSIAWRVHDAQWWGVPQRRKRICLLADFNGDSAGRILFELRRKTADGETVKTISNPRAERRQEVLPQSKGLSGDTSESGTQKQEVAGETETGIGETGEVIAFEPGAASRVGGHVYEDGISGAVRANAGDNQQAVVYGISAYESNAMKSGNPNSGIYEAETARTLDLNGGNPGCNQGGMAVVHCVDQGGGKSQCGVSEDVSPTLATTHGGEPVVCIEGNGQRESHKGDGYKESDTMYTLNTVEQHAVCIENHPADSRVKISEDGMVQTLSGRMGTGGGNVPLLMEEPYNATTGSFIRAGNSGIAETLAAKDYKDPQIVCNSVVRRLTPLECERLQGYPDGWTDIGEWYDSKGKKHKDADSPRYKALGNSIALPFWQYLADKMCAYLNKPTMASLFDGIGGFPLVFTRAGAKAVWGSEVDEFCIAVSKKHFPDNEYTVAISYLESRGL